MKLCAQRAHQDTTSAVTWPKPLRPIARAAPVDRSSTRPLMNGPRSLTVTTTLRLPCVTRSLVPKGSERWAQVIAFSLKRWPDAVLLPDSLPYMDAMPVKPCASAVITEVIAFALRDEPP